jgi:flagellar biogenesis protein FliO
MEDIAKSIDKLASAVYSLGGTIAFIGILFLLFKKMSGHKHITLSRTKPDEIEDD